MRLTIVDPPGETWSKKSLTTMLREYDWAASRRRELLRSLRRPREVRSLLSRQSVASRASEIELAVGMSSALSQARAVAGARANAATQVTAPASRRRWDTDQVLVSGAERRRLVALSAVWIGSPRG